MAVLTAPARLLDQLPFAIGGSKNGFFVSDLRLARVRFDLEFTHHAIADDFEVKFAHAGDDGLARFLVGEDAEGRVFLGQALEGDAHLFLVDLGLRLDGHGDDRFGEGRWLEKNRVVFVAKRIACGDVADADDRGDVARVTGVDILALVRLNLDEATDALTLAGAGVIDGIAFTNDAGIDAEENEFSDELIGPEFEGQRGELRVVGGGNFDDSLVVFRIHAGSERDVEGGRKVVDDGVEKILNAFVLESGAAGDGDEFVCDSGAADSLLELIAGDLLFH